MENTLITDPLPADPDAEEAMVYPIPPDRHIGVSTDLSTPPENTDQGDEEETREQSGIPN
jgi:hypothetical protein